MTDKSIKFTTEWNIDLIKEKLSLINNNNNTDKNNIFKNTNIKKMINKSKYNKANNKEKKVEIKKYDLKELEHNFQKTKNKFTDNFSLNNSKINCNGDNNELINFNNTFVTEKNWNKGNCSNNKYNNSSHKGILKSNYLYEYSKVLNIKKQNTVNDYNINKENSKQKFCTFNPKINKNYRPPSLNYNNNLQPKKENYNNNKVNANKDITKIRLKTLDY